MNRLIVPLFAFIALLSTNSALALQCPTDSIPIVNGKTKMNGKVYQSVQDIPIPNVGSIKLCLKVKKRADYLMMPYHYTGRSNKIMQFSSNTADLKQLPVIKSLKGYFENEVVIINAYSIDADRDSCKIAPLDCETPINLSAFFRTETGPNPIQTLCKNGFLPPYFNNIEMFYRAHVWGYRQVPISETTPKKYCFFLTSKAAGLAMYVADRTGPAQCGYHTAIYTPPKGSWLEPRSMQDAINTSARFGLNGSNRHLPRGIYTMEAIASPRPADAAYCSNLMEFVAYTSN